MKLLEARYGSLFALNDQLQQLLAGTHPTPYTEMPAILAIGLAHEGVSEDDLLDRPPMEYPALRRSLIDAINESFPDPEGKADEGDQGEASPGATSTTSPPSDSVAALASSGT